MAKKAEKGFDPLLVAACAKHNVDPADVLDCRSYEDRIVFVVRDERKLQVEREQQLE